MGLRPLDQGTVHSLERCSYSRKMLVVMELEVLELLCLEGSKAVLLVAQLALVEVEAGMKLMPIQEPMAVDQIHVGARGSFASFGGELAVLLP